MKITLTFRPKLRKGELRLKIELNLGWLVFAAWLLIG
jgi:hypothetical protein